MIFRGEYSFLSNFYPCKIVHEGIEYPSVEHAYQAYKTNDRELRRKIAKLDLPEDAKKFGRKIKIREDWNKIRFEVMKELLKIKFSDEHLMNRLKEVKGYIVEENWWGDTYWGVCRGRGENYLGKLLTMIRDGYV